MNEILYFKAKLTAESPLIIGSGIDDNTDSDILIGGDGNPYIPGTTIAGICRHYLINKSETKNYVNKIFGYTVDGEDISQNSNIIFYDANLNNDKYSISSRDGVKLGENKSALKGGKFDYEIIEAGINFDLRIELKSIKDVDGEQIIGHIVNGFNSHELRVGAKTTRGFGKIKTSDEKMFTLDLNTQMQQYIDFSWDKVNEKYTIPETDKNQYVTWKKEFDLQSFLFIRNYATTSQVYNVETNNNDGKIVDAEQLLNIEKKPVIPGTSWAGVFRHHFERILNKVNYGEDNIKKLIDKVFGYVIEGKQEDNAQPSKIIFSESVIKNSRQLNRTRNAIDRFTGGAGDKKLFTTRPTYKGCGTLEIKLPVNDFKEELELIESIINICIDDLNAGFLTVGGETSTGGGLINIHEKRCAE